MNSGKSFSTLIIVLLLALALLNIFSLIRGPAPTPDVFAEGYTLSQANELSAEQGKPVLVLATADWCPPCQSLKRGALSDPGVIELIRDNTIPVYLEDGTDSEEINMLGVRSYPTTLVIEKGQVTAIIEGGRNYAQTITRELALTP